MENKTCIYGLVDPRTNKVRYIGKTSKKPKVRFNAHICAAKAGEKCPVQYWIRKLLRENLTPELKIIEYVDHKDWEIAEAKWISFYRKDKTSVLLNVSDGGLDHSGNKKIARLIKRGMKKSPTNQKDAWTPEKRKAFSKQLKGKPTPWTVISSSRTYFVLFPDGHEEEVTNLTKFSKNLGLSPGAMLAIANNPEKSKQHKGFKVRKPGKNYPDPIKPYSERDWNRKKRIIEAIRG